MKKTKKNNLPVEEHLKIDMSFEEAIQKIVLTPKEKVDKLMGAEKTKNKPKIK